MLARSIVTAAALVALAAPATPADIPTPDFDRVDHAHPDKYLDLPASLGKAATIKKVAEGIKADTPRGKLAAIGAWIAKNLRNDRKLGYEFRDFDRILADGAYGGCQDHAEVFGALARACGIPTVWVKTMDCDWIRRFRRTRDENRSWSGHVFLEVHLDGKWALLDASAGLLFEDYDTRQRLFPGDRWAYDKGGDYHALVMSDRWEEWKKQTAKHFAGFDLSLLPVPAGARLPVPGQVIVMGNNPGWQRASERVQALGLRCGGGGNREFDGWIPAAREGWLVVLCLGGQVVLPEEHRALLPEGWEAVAEAKESGVMTRRAPDGTRVVLVHGRDAEALESEIARLALEEPGR